MKLGDWNITKHALQRGLQRRVNPDDILAAITTPELTRSSGNGRTVCEGSAATVVIDRATRTIITII